MKTASLHASPKIDGGPICYGYGRHSTVKQGLTRKAQRAKVKAYWRANLQKKGVRWGGFFYDRAVRGGTAFSEREEGRKVYAAARPKDYIVTARLDRAFRSVSDGVFTIETLKKRKVRFVSLDIRVNTATPAGRFFFNILLSVAELEREFARERAAEIIFYRKKHKLPLGKHSPVGWKIVGKGVRESGTMKSTRRFVIDERERAFVSEMYAKKTAGWSYERIALWCLHQKEFENKRSFANIKAVQWAVAAHELEYPIVTDGKKLVARWNKIKRQKAAQ